MPGHSQSGGACAFQGGTLLHIRSAQPCTIGLGDSRGPPSHSRKLQQWRMGGKPHSPSGLVISLRLQANRQVPQIHMPFICRWFSSILLFGYTTQRSPEAARFFSGQCGTPGWPRKGSFCCHFCPFGPLWNFLLSLGKCITYILFSPPYLCVNQGQARRHFLPPGTVNTKANLGNKMKCMH